MSMSNRMMGILSILGALLVLFSAMLEPMTSALIATVCLLALAVYSFVLDRRQTR